MQNLEQIRAKNALNAAPELERGKADGEVVKKVPAMIRENGLLAALAFAVEKNDKGEHKNKGHWTVFKAITDHLDKNDQGPEGMLSRLSKADAGMLRADTAEALAYLGYLRRFAQKGENHDRHGH